MDFAKFMPFAVAGGILSIPLLSSADPSETPIEWPDKFDRIEVHINVKNEGSADGSITLKVSVDSSSEKSKIEFKRTGEDGKASFENAEMENNDEKKAQYKNLGKVARQFIKVQHKLNLIKSQRWHEGGENAKFEELCRNCCGQSAEQCHLCVCCTGNCNPDPSSRVCCGGDQSTKYQLNKNSLGRFFLDLRNLNAANTSKYLSPMRVLMNFMPKADDKKYEEGSFWGSLIYGYVDYRYRKTDKPEEDPVLKDVVENPPTHSSDDNFFANIPHKFTFKMSGGEDGDLDKILDKLNKNLMGEMMRNSGNSSGGLCGCCEENAEKIECMVNGNYSVSLKNDSAISEFMKKFNTLDKECCKKVS